MSPDQTVDLTAFYVRMGACPKGQMGVWAEAQMGVWAHAHFVKLFFGFFAQEKKV